MPKTIKTRLNTPTILVALIITLTFSACYQSQISTLQFETTSLGVVIVSDRIQLKLGMQPFPQLSTHTIIVLVQPSEQVFTTTEQRVSYHIDAAFINEKCQIVRVITGIPPLPRPPITTRRATSTQDGTTSTAQPEQKPKTFYSSGYPAKYLAMAVSPILAERGVRPGQKVKFTGPASRIACN